MRVPDSGFRPAFNLQVATDVDSQVILGIEATNKGSDAGLAVPMVEQIEKRVKAQLGGYLFDLDNSAPNLKDSQPLRRVVYRLPERIGNSPSARGSSRQSPAFDAALLTGKIQPTAELHDPATGSWSAAGQMSGPCLEHAMLVLGDGRALVVGAVGSGTSLSPVVEAFDQSTGSWTAFGTLVTARTRHTATLLRSGTVLVAGGQAKAALSTAELGTPS